MGGELHVDLAGLIQAMVLARISLASAVCLQSPSPPFHYKKMHSQKEWRSHYCKLLSGATFSFPCNHTLNQYNIRLKNQTFLIVVTLKLNSVILWY